MQTVSTLSLFLFVGLVLLMATLTLLAVHRAGYPSGTTLAPRCGCSAGVSVNHEPVSTSRRWTLLTGIGLVLWLALTYGLAVQGIPADFSRFPSPFMMLLAGFTIFNIWLNAGSPFGKRLASGLSLHILFGFQVFRLGMEFLLMLFHQQGPAPIQVTLEGRNWDIITGVLALLVLVFFKDKPPSPSTYLALNLIGMGLVLNVVAVSVLSLPILIQVFTEDNTWITRAPYIWLPAFLVQLAIAGHLLSFRKLWVELKSIPNRMVTNSKL